MEQGIEDEDYGESLREQGGETLMPQSGVQREYAWKALEDTRDWIRFLDTKATLVFGAGSAMVLLAVQQLMDGEKRSEIRASLDALEGCMQWLSWGSLSCFVICLVALFVCSLLVLYPRSPRKKNAGSGSQPKDAFKAPPFFNVVDSVAGTEEAESWKDKLENSSEKDLLFRVSFELQKLWFIFSRKMMWVRLCIWFLTGCLMFAAIFAITLAFSDAICCACCGNG